MFVMDGAAPAAAAGVTASVYSLDRLDCAAQRAGDLPGQLLEGLRTPRHSAPDGPGSPGAEGRRAALVHFVAARAPRAQRRAIDDCRECALTFLPYDWTLNDLSLER